MAIRNRSSTWSWHWRANPPEHCRCQSALLGATPEEDLIENPDARLVQGVGQFTTEEGGDCNGLNRRHRLVL